MRSTNSNMDIFHQDLYFKFCLENYYVKSKIPFFIFHANFCFRCYFVGNCPRSAILEGRMPKQHPHLERVASVFPCGYALSCLLSSRACISDLQNIKIFFFLMLGTLNNAIHTGWQRVGCRIKL